jgi:hypothetical protein
MWFTEANAMIRKDTPNPEIAAPFGTAVRERNHRFRLLIVMAQGRPGALPEAWRSYARIDDARAGATRALQTPHVLHVAIVEDGSGLVGSVNPLGFVEWVDGGAPQLSHQAVLSGLPE